MLVITIRDNYSVQFIEKQLAALVKCAWDDSPLSAHDIIGRTVVSLVSSGSERGAYMDYFGGTTYPVESGYAAAMEVQEIGAAVTNVNVGDIVFAMVPHRVYNRVKDDEIIHIPAGCFRSMQ